MIYKAAIMNFTVGDVHKGCGIWPRRLLFFRGGVSQVELDAVITMEVQAIHRE